MLIRFECEKMNHLEVENEVIFICQSNSLNIVFLVATMLYLEKEWIIYERENTPDSIVPLFAF